MENPYFDRQLRTIIGVLRHDHPLTVHGTDIADFRYYVQAAGMAWKKGELDQLLFVRFVSQMLATTMDRSMRLNVDSPDYTPWQCGFDVRRFQDELIVTRAYADRRLQSGDRITKINTASPAEHRRHFQKNFLYATSPEREIWHNVLKMATHMEVVHPDGKKEDLPLQRFTAPRPPEESWTRALPHGTMLLHIGQLNREDALFHLKPLFRDIVSADRLILDLRAASGNSEEALLPLVPFILSAPKTMNEAIGPVSYRTLYTKENVALRLAQLEPYRDDPTAAALMRELKEKAGSGFQKETFTLWDDRPQIIRPMSRHVAVLIDTWTEGAPESFALLARREGRVRLVGRATMGTLDFADMISYQISPTAILTYPMSITEQAACGEGFMDRGVQPDVQVPFTPEETERDLVLAKALSLL